MLPGCYILESAWGLHEVYRIVERDDDHDKGKPRVGLTALSLSRTTTNIESRGEEELMRKEEVERETANRRREEEKGRRLKDPTGVKERRRIVVAGIQ